MAIRIQRIINSLDTRFVESIDDPLQLGLLHLVMLLFELLLKFDFAHIHLTPSLARSHQLAFIFRVSWLVEIESGLGNSWFKILVLIYFCDVRFHADALNAVQVAGLYLMHLGVVSGISQLLQLCFFVFDLGRCLNQRMDDSILNGLVEVLLEEVITFSGHRPERKLVTRVVSRLFNRLAEPSLRLVLERVTLESTILRGIEELVHVSLIESHVLAVTQLVDRMLVGRGFVSLTTKTAAQEPLRIDDAIVEHLIL